MPLKREADFNTFVEKIKLTIQTYLDDKANQRPEDNWSNEAKSFRDKELKTLCDSGNYSLVDLKLSLLAFCETLKSNGNKVASTIIGENATLLFGSLVGAKGSDLKRQLEELSKDIDPYKAEYFFDEIAMTASKNGQINSQSPEFEKIRNQSRLQPTTFLSAYSLKVLNDITGDNTKTQTFYSEAKAINRQSMSVAIVANFWDRFPNGYSESPTPKP